jgi:hypothetical protein
MTIDREILEAVAAGRLSPEEAAARLEEGADRPSAVGPDAPAGGASGGASPADADPTDAGGRVQRVRIAASARPVRIMADPGVREAEVDGHHRVRREDSTLVISGIDAMDGGFSFGGRRRSYHDWRELTDLTEWRRFTQPLVVRVNPDLAVTAELSAGTLTVVGMRGPIEASLAAGSARLQDVTGPLDLTIRAGSIRIQGRLATGASRVSCDAGSVVVHLDRGSSVRVRTFVELGRVRVHGPQGESGGGEVVVGSGEALLEIDATMASVELVAEDPIVVAPVAG